MTEEQRQLAADNHNLIYSFMNKHHLDFDAIEDWYGTCAIGLCKAAMAFDESKGLKFPTLAYVCMKNEVGCVLRKNQVSTTSLDNIIEDNEGITNFHDILPDNKDTYGDIEVTEIILKYYNKLKDRDKKIINDCIYEDISVVELGQKYGLARNTISRIYNKFFNSIYTDLYGKDGGYIG